MDTFYKCCSLHPGGVFKSSWVCTRPGWSLTYAFNEKTEPEVGKLFGATRHQVASRTVDTSVQTDFGVILEGEGELAPGPFEEHTLADGYRREAIWKHMTSSIYAMSVGTSRLGVLLDWFTPKRIVAVYQYRWDIVPTQVAAGILGMVGIKPKVWFHPHRLLA